MFKKTKKIVQEVKDAEHDKKQMYQRKKVRSEAEFTQKHPRPYQDT